LVTFIKNLVSEFEEAFSNTEIITRSCLWNYC